MATFEWYASNTTVSYPFTDLAAPTVNKLFVDAYVIHSGLTTTDQRLKITSFDPVSTPKVITLRFEDNTLLATLSATNLSSTPDKFYSAVFGDYTIYEWRRIVPASVGFTTDEVIVRVVVLTSALSDFSFPLALTGAVLVPSLVNPHVKRVRKLAIKLPGVDCCSGGGFGDGFISFQAGNNIKLSKANAGAIVGLGLVQERESRTPNVIVIDAIPGEGTGPFNECADGSAEIKTISGVGADVHGNFVLEGKDCTWVERPIEAMDAAVHPNTDYLSTSATKLKLHDDCKACCECTDFADSYAQMSALWDRALLLSTRIENLRKSYNAQVEAMAAIKASKCSTPLAADLNLITRPDFHLAVGLTLVNNSGFRLRRVTLTFTFLPHTGFQPTFMSGFLETSKLKRVPLDPTDLGGGVYKVTVPAIKIGGLLRYSFEGRYYGGGSGNAGRANMNPKVTCDINAQPKVPVILSINKSLPLNRPLLKD